MGKTIWILGILMVFADARAETPTSCPSEELCPRYESSLEACEKNKKSKACDEFVKVFRKLTPRYDCQRSFDTKPVPAVWLCDELKTEFPKPYQKGVQLLSRLKSKRARAFFGSEELRSTMDGEVAEEFLAKSKAAGKSKKSK